MMNDYPKLTQTAHWNVGGFFESQPAQPPHTAHLPHTALDAVSSVFSRSHAPAWERGIHHSLDGITRKTSDESSDYGDR